MMEIQKGDFIRCHDKDDMVKVFTEMSKLGYELEFVYEKDGEKGLWLEVQEVPKRG